MKLSLRYFLLACFLLGAMGVPLGWRLYQTRKTAEIESLEKELAELRKTGPPGWTSYPPLSATGSGTSDEDRKWAQRIVDIETRLEKLTGKRPLQTYPPATH